MPRSARSFRDAAGGQLRGAIGTMTTISPTSTPAVPDDTILRLALAAHLARYKGQSRDHVHSDLRSFLSWSQARHVASLAATRPQIELYVRWMQEIQHYKPSTVSRRLSIIVGFYRTCVIDHILEHSPADYVRRPHVAPESPTLGLSHLQFEAMLTTARDSTNPYDFALVTMLGLLGLRIFEATGASIEDLGEMLGGESKVALPAAPVLGEACVEGREAVEPAGVCAATTARSRSCGKTRGWTGCAARRRR